MGFKDNLPKTNSLDANPKKNINLPWYMRAKNWVGNQIDYLTEAGKVIGTQYGGDMVKTLGKTVGVAHPLIGNIIDSVGEGINKTYKKEDVTGADIVNANKDDIAEALRKKALEREQRAYVNEEIKQTRKYQLRNKPNLVDIANPKPAMLKKPAGINTKVGYAQPPKHKAPIREDKSRAQREEELGVEVENKKENVNKLKDRHSKLLSQINTKKTTVKCLETKLNNPNTKNGTKKSDVKREKEKRDYNKHKRELDELMDKLKQLNKDISLEESKLANIKKRRLHWLDLKMNKDKDNFTSFSQVNTDAEIRAHKASLKHPH